MKVLLDTNVILDVLLHREPFYEDSRAVYDLVERHEISGCVSSSAMTDIFYLLYKAIKDTGEVYSLMDDVARLFTIAPVLESTITEALALRWKDFEDAVQFAAARESGAAVIITRNMTGYETSAIPCISPAAFTAFMRQA
ncbi:MAG: PIN domain-containing protein [Treponema sp.]|jgi:predicted nucleic acid-binding protein|nr:PIN domain-containing protein [Treponema sp.]